MSQSNDLAAGLDRMATDLSAYYLLGYQPEPSASGKWHKLEVRVNRPGVEVRARRGYRAGPPAIERAPDKKGARGEWQKLVTASLAGGARDILPVRLAASLQAPDGAGKARVQMVMEVDGSRVRLEEAPEGAKAALDLTILAVARDHPTVVPLGETINVALTSKKGADWWTFVREVRLPPGVAQIRAMVRDKTGTAAGTVTARIEVPDVEAPYLGTPLLTDRTQPLLALLRRRHQRVPMRWQHLLVWGNLKGGLSMANTRCSASAGATCPECPRSWAATRSRPRTGA
jgi:hypothetical protein